MKRNYEMNANEKIERLKERRARTVYLDEYLRYTLAINLKRLRQASGKGQTEIAKELGTNQKNLSQWEAGEVLPSLYYVYLLAQCYKVTVNDLLKEGL